MSADKTIPLKAVSDALMCAVIRLKTKGHEASGKRHGRFAAFTQVPHPFVYRCPDACRGHGLVKQIPWHFSAMEAGDMPAVLRRVRGHGLPEVRKTFGAGLRELQREFEGTMR
ncbi:hypothetical protein CKO44_15990 [Rubrivivax gelatinosus]|uniref:hypothetical protein n=1 Tax=Rubrivivax gelatinosus TaxID=28068 RepID=UPI001908E8E5|nr:hypothetical protein [Rubrivivax gelatinosus]MBK1614970.1 hypothetical protein [Rubrivivax gelatinosus]MBZ8143829.1 hypothetical protein [Rubrivivax gelatinosus]